MAHVSPALEAGRFLRSVDATRATLGKPPMKLLALVDHISQLTHGAPFAVIGGLAQILWARKSHTDDLDVVLAPVALHAAIDRVRAGHAPTGWSLPKLPDRAHERDAVFEVVHLHFDGAVVDLISFCEPSFNDAIISTATTVHELGDAPFIVPELLLVTQLLRPGPAAAIAAIELVIARRAAGGLDVDLARKWATVVGRAERLERVLTQADAMDVV